MNSKDSTFSHNRFGYLTLYVISVILWCFAVLLSLVNVLNQQQEVAYQMAEIHADSKISNDLQYYKWITSNRSLTQMERNHSLRMILESQALNEDSFIDRIHITCVQSSNPDFAADHWEQNALNELRNGLSVFSSIEDIDGRETLRLMKIFPAEEILFDCEIKAKADPEKLVRGISVQVPVQPFNDMLRDKEVMMVKGHIILLLIGFLSISAFFIINWFRKLERSKHIATIEAEYQRFKRIMNAMDAVIYVADMRTHDLLFMNKKAVELGGEYKGKKCWEVLQVGQTGQCTFCNNDKLIDEEGRPTGPQVREFKNTKTNEWYECHDVAIPWIDGKIVRLEIATEITKRKEAELETIEAKKAAEEAKKCREDFLAIMSHEMRTPLNPIIGFADLMLEEHPNEQDQTYLRTIIRSANHQLDLINNLLNYAKLEKSDIEIKETEFDVLQVCRNAINDVRHVSHGLDVSLVNGSDQLIRIPEGTIVLGEQSMLIQVLDNLLNNACKYTEAGSVTLKIGTLETGTEKKLFRFEIVDTGIGISEEGQKTLFDPFVQADTSYTREYDGAGLGLAICQKIIMRLGGAIGVDSQINEGSRFWFQLGMETIFIPENETKKEKIEPFKSLKLDEPYHILIVEDNDDNVLILQTILTQMGAKSDVVHNGLEAVKITQNKLFDLIFMDLSMPIMNGIEATERIREKDNLNSTTPIYALSADVTTGVEQRCKSVGMKGYLAKPVSYRQLYDVITDQFEV